MGCSSTDVLDPFCQQRWLPVYAHLTVLVLIWHAAFENLNLPTAVLFPYSVFGLQELFPLEGESTLKKKKTLD